MASSCNILLEAQGIEKKFGGIVALSEYALKIERGELIGLIGPNGAGKTTVFNILSGVLAPTNGSIRFEDRELSGQGPAKTAQAGIARTFQNIRLFDEMTVLDNIRTGFHHSMGSGLFATLLQLPRQRKSEHSMTRRAGELAELIGISKLLDMKAGDLPYGDQRRLEIARALALGPKLLLLDEPAAGMNPGETEALVKTIKIIHKEFHLSILLVEHDMHLVMNLCERLQVLNHGRLLAEGTPSEIQNNPQVAEAYLGTGRKGEARQ
ncbi:ABC transporter ATP-binding protein [uncultured Pseudodesulfovibrio sp.]|uniref:ABC transporter ATP-binding protein n=1 Tax=uncultured Pseudodesulfovibrio sp. TaxID=2035858 RepID=UPI0029C61D1F|nr:ABC transporter ATP-binding protein [uncultured Pseudodesulfovibrio sp.]